jgi:hypothetical protein
MDFDQHLRETAAWLVKMAESPLSVDHAKHREQELIASSPLYADLPRYIREARARQSSSACAPAAAKTTASTGRTRRAA